MLSTLQDGSSKTGSKKNRFELDPEAKDKIQDALLDEITQSEISLRQSCPRKWFYRYVLRLQRRGYVNPHLVYGILIHHWLEWLYKNHLQGTIEKEMPSSMPAIKLFDFILDAKQQEEIDLAIQKAWIAFKAYRHHYKGLDSKLFVISNEVIYRTEFMGFNLSGKIDMVAKPTLRDGEFIWDFKSAGRLDANVLDAWSFRFQFLYYCWLYWKATGKKPSGTIVNGLVKCQLKPKMADRKTRRMETREEYLYRVAMDMQEYREKYFYRQRMPLAKGQLEWFENDILVPNLQSFDQMKRWLKLENRSEDLRSVVLAMHTSHCHVYNSVCEYLPLCKDGKIQLDEYFVSETKHSELELETAEE